MYMSFDSSELLLASGISYKFNQQLTMISLTLISGIFLTLLHSHSVSARGNVTPQKHLEWSTGNCLPGPLQHADYPGCATTLLHLDEDDDNITIKSHNNSPTNGKWTPWTHRPYCADTDYCVFTNANIGLSIITTQDESDALLKSTSPHSNHDENDKVTPAYEMRDIANKGKGLVATRKIPRGEVLMVDSVALLAALEIPRKMKQEKGRLLFSRAVERLPRAGEILGLARSSSSDEGANAELEDGASMSAAFVEGVVKINSFTVEVGGMGYMGLFPRIARINHACHPSAYFRFDQHSLKSTIRAFRDIDAGEEITISYATFGLTRAERQHILHLNWGFECDCSLCTAPQDEIAASDARRGEIKILREKVLREVEGMDFKEAITLNRELYELIAKEELVSHMGDHYEVMARLHMGARDRAGAKKYAKMALVELKKYSGEGKEGKETIRELEELVEML
ncbi:hypothetical protein B0T17DRAFT_513273 [Bombardia bombarda]|uniref:SET domain-containing protein n=1 Tax=Bombardia bombarda TaxID=252184 RepID=A0AA39XIV5_9PEZI|nr:hypothetical protein B0T17DRAFT_513273 [Bombardia bombarda]